MSDIRRPAQKNFFQAAPSQFFLPEEDPVPFDPVPAFIGSARPYRKPPRNFFRIGMLFLILAFCGWGFAAWTLAKKQNLEAEAGVGFERLAQALDSLEKQEFAAAAQSFEEAGQIFEKTEGALGWWGKAAKGFTRIPGLSKLATAQHALESGRYLASAGKSLSETASLFFTSKNMSETGPELSFLDFLTQAKAPLSNARVSLEQAERSLGKVRTENLPAEKRGEFLRGREQVSALLGILIGFEEHERLWEELLGGNGPRKYLFLLQNNHELRATGGFIGSYGLLDVNQGIVRRFFVDGIFNPDGQLKENIVPPKPIQKISAAWSLHDSNWFPDFPTSAEKAIFFYEKTGGPTVDGVITLTPTVMQKLLAVTGPIVLSEYGLEVDAENFIPVIQEEVEVNYDKERNEPKKILADLSLVLLEKVFASRDQAALSQMAQALVEGLNEKHLLLYMRHPETQALIEKAGWSGKIMDTPKDYLAVIHTNINGYKTDGVISERIKHQAVIEKDGSIVDTLTITRRHHGGGMPFDWWNKVNADYLRVYVPKGSELLSVQGTTWEFPEAPLDYRALGFREDPDLKKEEANIRIDEKSGTRLYEDAGKSVFGSWVYVSPQEEVTVEFRYRLPFRLDVSGIEEGGVDSYTVLYQKQPGTLGSRLESSLTFPDELSAIWQTGVNLLPYERKAELQKDLKADAYAGVVFGANSQ